MLFYDKTDKILIKGRINLYARFLLFSKFKKLTTKIDTISIKTVVFGFKRHYIVKYESYNRETKILMGDIINDRNNVPPYFDKEEEKVNAPKL